MWQRNEDTGENSGDDLAPPQLSALGRSILDGGEGNHVRLTKPAGPRGPQDDPALMKSSKPGGPTMAQPLRLRRVKLQGAPVRRLKLTPTGEQPGPPQGHVSSSQDQECLFSPEYNLKRQPSARLENAPTGQPKSHMPGTIGSDLGGLSLERSADPPQKPASLPPPKQLQLGSATMPAETSTLKKKKAPLFIVNGKRYVQLGRKFGKGGSSDVYRVKKAEPQVKSAEPQAKRAEPQVFALKKVKLAGADDKAIKGYLAEIELLSVLKTESRVVNLHDYQIDEDNQRLFMVMELGDSDLSGVIRSKTKISPRLDLHFTRFYWQEMLRCVEAVHAHDIVHSDLKPANFLLVRGKLKIIDFGIADAIDIDNTINVYRDSHVGTVNFMSPESLRDNNGTLTHGSNTKLGLGKMMKLGKPSDVWSLGCILYQMVYGQPPFAHLRTMAHQALAIIDPSFTIEYPTSGLGDVQVPKTLRRTLAACLDRDPSARLTVAALLSDEDPWLYPDSCDDLRISEKLLGHIIDIVVRRFEDQSKPVPTEEEVEGYAASFYSKIRMWYAAT